MVSHGGLVLWLIVALPLLRRYASIRHLIFMRHHWVFSVVKIACLLRTSSSRCIVNLTCLRQILKSSCCPIFSTATPRLNSLLTRGLTFPSSNLLQLIDLTPTASRRYQLVRPDKFLGGESFFDGCGLEPCTDIDGARCPPTHNRQVSHTWVNRAFSPSLYTCSPFFSHCFRPVWIQMIILVIGRISLNA